MLLLNEHTGLMLSMFKEIKFEKQYQKKKKEENFKNAVDTDMTTKLFTKWGFQPQWS